MAGERLKLNDQQLNELQNRLLEVAAGLSEVTGGGYVPPNVFSESTGGATAELNQFIHVLSLAANMMYDAVRSAASYFETVIDRFDQWDRGEAVIVISGQDGFDSAVMEYQNELQIQRSDPSNLPQSSEFQMPDYPQPTDYPPPTDGPQPTSEPQAPPVEPLHPPQPKAQPQPQPPEFQMPDYPQPTDYPQPPNEPQLPSAAQPAPPPVAPPYSTPTTVPSLPTPSTKPQPSVYPQQTTPPQPPVEVQPEPQPAAPSATPTP